MVKKRLHISLSKFLAVCSLCYVCQKNCRTHEGNISEHTSGNKRRKYVQAGAELGKDQLELGLDFTLNNIYGSELTCKKYN